MTSRRCSIYFYVLSLPNWNPDRLTFYSLWRQFWRWGDIPSRALIGLHSKNKVAWIGWIERPKTSSHISRDQTWAGLESLRSGLGESLQVTPGVLWPVAVSVQPHSPSCGHLCLSLPAAPFLSGCYPGRLGWALLWEGFNRDDGSKLGFRHKGSGL